ncbi:MAG: hypothetical protein ACON49_07055 [Candidatus Puniceispirillaceae bacterium]
MQSQLIVTRRFTEMETIGSQLQDIQSRYDSLLALLGNSRVSRRDIIELIQTRAEKTIELETLQWQQEFAYVQINWLADNLTPLLGITLGDSQC